MNHRCACVIATLVLQICSCKHPVETAAPEQSEVSLNTEAAREHLVSYVDPVFPDTAPGELSAGEVTLDVHIGIDGRVTKATPIRGTPELRQAAVDAVLKWRYRPVGHGKDLAPAHTQVEISFHRSPIAEEENPETISGLPAEVRQDLNHRGCLIPRYRGAPQGGYTKGSFRAPGSEDYAVICHIPARGVQNVLVYSNTDGAWVGEVIFRGTFDPAPHTDLCEVTVGIASPKDILDHARAYAPEELKSLPHLDHIGVAVELCEKASIFYYFHQGKWLQLQGAD